MDDDRRSRWQLVLSVALLRHKIWRRRNVSEVWLLVFDVRAQVQCWIQTLDTTGSALCICYVYMLTASSGLQPMRYHLCNTAWNILWCQGISWYYCFKCYTHSNVQTFYCQMSASSACRVRYCFTNSIRWSVYPMQLFCVNKLIYHFLGSTP